MKTIDMNCDMGEFPAAIADRTQELLMPYLTSVNVACGGHAGDAQTMRQTIEQALRWKLAIGAHPGYPDRANFGRVDLQLSAEALAGSVFLQLCALAEVASACGAQLTHVKPHGALYNQAARDRAIAMAFVAGVARWSHDVVLVGLADSLMLDVFRDAGFPAAAEAFADRRYKPDGSLRPRNLPDALIKDPVAAGQQALLLVNKAAVTASDGSEIAVHAQTICIHGDTPGALEIAAGVNQALREAGVALRPISGHLP